MDNATNSTRELLQNATKLLSQKETEYPQLPDITFQTNRKGKPTNFLNLSFVKNQ